MHHPLIAGSTTVLTRQARAALVSWVKAPVPRAHIVGPAGSGKTTLIRRLSEALVDAGRDVVTLDQDTALADIAPSTTLLVDDLQGLAPDRLAAISARAGDRRASLVVAARPWPVSPAAAAVATGLETEAVPILLGQVARSDVLALMDDLGATLSASCVDHILHCTGGLTWLVSCALEAHDERDCDSDAGHRELDHMVEAQVIHRFDTLPEPLSGTLRHLCAEPPAGTDELTSAALNHDHLMTGYALGLLLRNGRAVPVVRDAARHSLPARRTDVSDESAATPEDLLVERAAHAWASGDVATASTMVEALQSDTSVRANSLATDISAAVWATRAMMSTASDVYAHGSGDAGAGVRATLAHLGAGTPARVAPRREPAPGDEPDPSAHLTTQISLRLLDKGLRGSVDRAPSPAALTDLVRASELYSAGASTAPIPELPAVVVTAAAIGAGEFATAQQAIDSAVADGQGGAWAQRRLLLWQAWVAMQGERPADARASLEAAEHLAMTGTRRDELIHEAVRVGLARRYDTKASLEIAWAAAREQVRHLDVDLYLILPLTSLICSAAGLRDPDTLAPHLEKSLAIIGALGDPPVWATHLWWAGVQRGILMNRPDQVAPHARALAAATDANALAAVMASAGSVWMSVLAGTFDPEHVEEAARALADAGLAWDGARLAGHGSRRAHDRKAIGRLLSVARELHPRENGSRQETTDASSPQVSIAASGLLSDRELDVALLVLEGRTYNEIGRTIFISPKTVEHHVAHIKRRLGASSRSDLMAKLRVLVETPADASAPAPPGRTGDAHVSP